jgi:hypothetical protein
MRHEPLAPRPHLVRVRVRVRARVRVRVRVRVLTLTRPTVSKTASDAAA